ncbi:hypothetical protein chiPu_0012306 [Chiloscyllium punctatum]|uniref:Uncharacterized protein n=1 Tax=Chiloscyllium punctatum TaxID=137246 RepID=A0A401STW5_CHIPU|nr:hypothetical protein [Chiloscyllium punctatum]
MGCGWRGVREMVTGRSRASGSPALRPGARARARDVNSCRDCGRDGGGGGERGADLDSIPIAAYRELSPIIPPPPARSINSLHRRRPDHSRG